jgi:hypothetical protein
VKSLTLLVLIIAAFSASAAQQSANQGNDAQLSDLQIAALQAAGISVADLKQMPPGQLPPLATFYSISLVGQAGGLGPPLPFDLLADLNLPIFWAPVYNIDGMTQSNAPSNIFIVDDSSVAASAAQQQSSINQLLTFLEKHSRSANKGGKTSPPSGGGFSGPHPLDLTNFPPGSLGSKFSASRTAQ